MTRSKEPAAAHRLLPKLDTTCDADADCVVISDEERAASGAWYRQFQAACAAAPAPMCPPIGCAQPEMHPVCRANKCETG